MQAGPMRNGHDAPSDVHLYETIHNHLTGLGFSKNGKGYYVDGVLTKQKIRDLHSAQRKDILKQRQSFVETQGSALIKHFASGRDVNPTAIDPEIVEVKSESLDSRIFRFACLLWSVPVSQGFGRRLRFLVRDRQNGQLIGIFCSGRPSLQSFRPRQLGRLDSP